MYVRDFWVANSFDIIPLLSLTHRAVYIPSFS